MTYQTDANLYARISELECELTDLVHAVETHVLVGGGFPRVVSAVNHANTVLSRATVRTPARLSESESDRG